MLKLGRGLKPELQARHDEPITPASKHPPWQAPLSRLSQLLSQPEWHKAEVNVVLSNRLVRFMAITISPQLRDYPVREAFARHALTHTFGAAAAGWTLRIQQDRAGSPRLVSALDQALLDGLRQACATHQHKLRSVTPCLIPFFNRARPVMKTNPSWMVISEPGYSLFALLSGDGFVAVHGVCHDNMDELSLLLDRENLASPLTEPCMSVYLYAPSCADSSAIPKMGYELIKLDLPVPAGFPPPSEGLHAMTMSEFL